MRSGLTDGMQAIVRVNAKKDTNFKFFGLFMGAVLESFCSRSLSF